MATELERRIVAIEVTGEQKAVHAYERVTAAGDKMTKGATSFASGIGAVNSKLGALATGGAGIFRMLTSAAGGVAGAVVGIGASFVSAIGGLAMSAVKTLVSWLATATKMALGLAAAGTAVGIAFTKAAIGAAIQRDTAMRSLTSLMGAGPAQQHFGDLRNVAKLPGMDLNSAMQFSRGLQAVNVNAETTLRLLRAIGNALALSGKGPEELGRVGIQLQQMFAKGKVMAEDVIVVSESLPQFRQAIKDAFGTSDTEALIKRGLTATEILAGVVGQLEKLPKATTGPANALVNLRMAWDDLLVSFGQAFAQAGGIEVINKLAEGLAKLAPVMKALGEQAATALPALGDGLERAFKFLSNPDAINKWAKGFIDGMTKVGLVMLNLVKTIAEGARSIVKALAGVMKAVAGALLGQVLLTADYTKMVALTTSAKALIKQADEMEEKYSLAAGSMINWAEKSKAAVVGWQDAAKKAVDRTTEAIKQQTKAIEQYGKVVRMGQLAALQSPGTPMMAGAQAYIGAFQSRGPLGYGSVAGSTTPEQHDANWKAEAKRREAVVREGNAIIKNWQKGLIDSHKAIEQLNALNTAESRARAGSIASIEAEKKARAEYQQWLYGQLHSIASGGVGGLFNNAMGLVKRYQQAQDMATRLPGTWMAQSAMSEMGEVGPLLSRLGFTDPTKLPSWLAALAPKSAGAAGKPNSSAFIEGDYRAQRERERMSLNDRLAQQVIGNLGAGDQGILSQAKLGQQADAMTIAARRAGRDIGGIIADAIGYELPRAVEAAVARRIRLDYQGAN